MTMNSLLLVASLAIPFAWLAAFALPNLRGRALSTLWLAPAPALAAGLVGLGTGPPIEWTASSTGPSLSLDRSGALLLVSAALLWMMVSLPLFRSERPNDRMGLCWLMTMVGNLGVFVAGDLVSFYCLYALASIPAFGLFAFSPDGQSRRAGAVYMAFTILGEAVLLLAFAMLVASEPHGSLRIHDVMASLAASPWRGAVLALVIAGFGMKIGTVPFNGWMPLTYTASPTAVAMVLSGAGVNAGVIGLLRFLPLGDALPVAGSALMGLGFVTAFYGVLVGLTQRQPSTVLAYSSISQMGLIAAACGAALGQPDLLNSDAIAFYAANHLFVKAALFLTVSLWAIPGINSSRFHFVLAGALALGLAGLPPTGGYLAKLALKPGFASGVTASLATLSSIGSALLMTHFVMCLEGTRATEAAPAGLLRNWLAVAAGAMLVPWALYGLAGEAMSKAFGLSNLVDATWPVAVGLALAFVRRRAHWSLPDWPEGDTIGLWEAGFGRVMRGGPPVERLEARSRQWPASSLALVIIALVIAGASALGH